LRRLFIHPPNWAAIMLAYIKDGRLASS
jgi:hypothetical protein